MKAEILSFNGKWIVRVTDTMTGVSYDFPFEVFDEAETWMRNLTIDEFLVARTRLVNSWEALKVDARIMNIIDAIEEKLQARESQIIRNAARFVDETQEQFEAKIAGRLNSVVVLFRATEFPADLDWFFKGMSETELPDYKIWRKRVDELDNVYCCRRSHA